MQDLVLSVSDFVAIFNQTIEYAYPNVVVQGEIANFRVSKNRWVYFDLKDELASVKFFGTVYQLPGPLEDGLLVQVSGQPRLHPQYGFSITVQFIQPVGEGALKRAAELLEAKLAAEGLFDPARKRVLPYPPARIGLITSGESAAYRDFIKVLNGRWSGIEILLVDTQVQGEAAISQITDALEYFNTHAEPVDTIVITRGGGSTEDMAVFNVEQVVRAVAGSRIPTMVAIGHEIDVCLSEMAADVRASTPSNAAELLVPDKRQVQSQLSAQQTDLNRILNNLMATERHNTKAAIQQLQERAKRLVTNHLDRLQRQRQLLTALSPQAVLKRGYVVIRQQSAKTIMSARSLKRNDKVTMTFHDGQAGATITSVNVK